MQKKPKVDGGGCFRKGPGKLPRPPNGGAVLNVRKQAFFGKTREITLRVRVGYVFTGPRTGHQLTLYSRYLYCTLV